MSLSLSSPRARLLTAVSCRFHVDSHSSAHVYIRMPKGMTFETLPLEVITDCAQLTKQNSIEGVCSVGHWFFFLSPAACFALVVSCHFGRCADTHAGMRSQAAS